MVIVDGNKELHRLPDAENWSRQGSPTRKLKVLRRNCFSVSENLDKKTELFGRALDF
ncbi:hypothetical protein [Oryza sativa Japonica Group]|uniref:Uncharacterized protein n=1 Tax=Oryza sativa subsp. japonica TaxID=39947 RepID=Q5ZBQ7_ORYSJ|nr:hypothetical protein [Oryza sativa Japonica Group]